MAKSSGKAGSLFYGMTLDAKDFKKRLKDVRKTLKSVGDEMRESFATISTGFAVVGAGVAAGTTAMLAFAHSTAEANNEQILLANSIGSTHSEVAGLELATNKWGVETDMVIDKMREFGGMDEFKKLADDVKNAGDEQAQLNKAVELFGGEGAKMLALLQQGSAGLEAMEQEAIALGLALSPKQIAENTVAWGQFEDALLSLKGLGKQIGTSFNEMFGTAAAGAEGLIKTFGTDIKGAFKGLADFITGAMEVTFNWFADNGIPFINAFVNFANNIGEAFANIFNFIRGEGDSTFNFIGSLFSGFTDFLATFKQSLVAGITNAISGVVKGATSILVKFNTFLGELAEGFAAILQKLPGVSDDLAKKVREATQQENKNIKAFYGDIVKSLDLVTEQQTDEAAKILEKQRKQNEKQAAIFKGITKAFSFEFEKAGEKLSDANKKAADAVDIISGQRATLAATGTQEEFKIRNQQQDRLLTLNQQQLTELKKANRLERDKGVI